VWPAEETTTKIKIMAKNIGLIKISGKVGDLQFFKKEGKSYVGLSSNISKERIQKDPAFKRTRENMSEFGGAAKVSKSIREYLIPLKSLIEKQLHNRVTSMVRQLINVGSGDRGKRAVEFSANQTEVNGFELNKSTKVSEVMFTSNTLVTNADRNQLILTIEEFLPSDYLLIPEGATHFRVHLAGLAISDFAPVGPKNKYLPINETQHGAFIKDETSPIPVSSLVTGGITLTVDLPGAPVLAPEVSLAGFIGIEFLQDVNGTFYQLASNNALRIEKLF